MGAKIDLLPWLQSYIEALETVGKIRENGRNKMQEEI